MHLWLITLLVLTPSCARVVWAARCPFTPPPLGHPTPVLSMPTLTHPEFLALLLDVLLDRQLSGQLTFPDSSHSGSSSNHTAAPSPQHSDLVTHHVSTASASHPPAFSQSIQRATVIQNRWTCAGIFIYAEFMLLLTFHRPPGSPPSSSLSVLFPPPQIRTEHAAVCLKVSFLAY